MVLSYLPMVVVATQVVACRLQAGSYALSLLYTARARGAWLDPHYMARERSICTLCTTSCTTIWGVHAHTVERYIAMYVVATYSAMCTAHLHTGVHAHSSAAEEVHREYHMGYHMHPIWCQLATMGWYISPLLQRYMPLCIR